MKRGFRPAQLSNATNMRMKVIVVEHSFESTFGSDGVAVLESAGNLLAMLDHRRARAQVAGMQSSRRVVRRCLALLSAVRLLFLPQSLSAQLRLEPGLFL